MADAYVGEIKIFSGTYAPRNWAFCNGQILQISQYEMLASLIGSTYGGDGRVTFALPDLRGRIVMGQGSGPGLTPRTIGQSFGSEYVTLTESQMPSHAHHLQASKNVATTTEVTDAVLAATVTGDEFYLSKEGAAVHTLKADAIENTGAGQKHYNVQPVLGVNYIICLMGDYPSKN